MTQKRKKTGKSTSPHLIVRWNDAALYAEWGEVDDAGLVRCVSSGFLVEATKDVIKVAQTRSFGRSPWGGILSIPRNTIIDVHRTITGPKMRLKDNWSVPSADPATSTRKRARRTARNAE